MAFHYISKLIFGLTVAFLIAPEEVTALFPKVCVSPENLSAKECCPVPDGFTEKCGGPGRGECVNLRLMVNDPHEMFDGDLDRFQWPMKFFNRTCKCQGNFDGASCSTCMFGWTGVNCDTKKSRTRRNILNMSPKEVNQFKDYLLRAKEILDDYVIPTTLYKHMNNGNLPQFNEISLYDKLVYYHYYTARENLVDKSGGEPHKLNGGARTVADFAHLGPAFPTWHRAYLLMWEQAIHKVAGDNDFALPYWDWAGQTTCQVCTDEYVGGSDATNGHRLTGTFSNFTTLCHNAAELRSNGTLCANKEPSTSPIIRRPGGHPDLPAEQTLPSKQAVYYALSVETYDTIPVDYHPTDKTWMNSHCSFRNILEGFADSEGFTGLHSSDVHQIHNQVHLYLNGTISEVPLSANDPIFLLHHSNIDRIFEKWIRRHKVASRQFPSESTPVGQNRDSYMVPFFPVRTNDEFFKRSDVFGYTYDDIDDQGLSTEPQEREREIKAMRRMPKCSVPKQTFSLLGTENEKTNQSAGIHFYISVTLGLIAIAGSLIIVGSIWRRNTKKFHYQQI